jgi:hypothetical protein
MLKVAGFRLFSLIKSTQKKTDPEWLRAHYSTNSVIYHIYGRQININPDAFFKSMKYKHYPYFITFTKIFILFHSETIKKFIPVLFLLIFALGNMPRQYFHEELASHRDSVTACNHAQNAMGCFHQVNFNCHYDNLVVNTVYEAESFNVPVYPVVHSIKYYTLFISPGNPPHPGNKENKGPPALA